MKSSTSWPSWSRKYSATVSPVRATRARAPGGSFICPYTRATLEVLSLREMTTLNHLVVQIVALPGPLTDTGEH